MILYSYWRSTTSYRVRVALEMKGLSYEVRPVDLLSGAHRTEDYKALNPMAAVPTLVLGDGTAVRQSLAILELLDAIAPAPPLVPADPVEAAKTRTAAQIIACDIHPVNNLRVVAQLKAMGHGQDAAVTWMHHWMMEGFAAFEAQIDPTKPFCFGSTPGLADICLVAQLYNAHRWGLDLAPFPRLTEIETACLALPAFQAAAPEAQIDAA